MLFTVTYFVVLCCLSICQTESLSAGLSKLLLDVEKNKLLQKLNLKSRPSPNHLVRRDLPVPINEQYQKVLSEMQELSDYIPQKDETFIFAQKIGNTGRLDTYELYASLITAVNLNMLQ